MDAERFDATPKTVAFISAGRLTLRESFAMPFMSEVNADLANNGFHDLDADPGYEFLDENFAVPQSFFSPGSTPPTALFGVDDLAIGVILFLGSSLGSWAVEKVADGVYDRWIRPHLAHLVRRLGTEGPAPERVPFELSVWFDHDRVAVTVKAEVTKESQEAFLQHAIAQAIADASEWASHNNATNKRISFDVANRESTLPPTISDL